MRGPAWERIRREHLAEMRDCVELLRSLDVFAAGHDAALIKMSKSREEIVQLQRGLWLY